MENFDNNIQQLLSKHIDDVFEITNTNQNSGNLWWVKSHDFLPSDAIPLSKRVETTIQDMFKIKEEYSLDDILGEIFIRFPNGLTPDIRNIEKIISKYAIKSGNKWMKRKG